MADKIDLFKELKAADYAQPRKPALIETTEGVYLTIDGQGEPGGDEFGTRIGALYSVAYTVKMTRKFDGGQDYVVGKLEAQWWTDDGKRLEDVSMEAWRWKLLMRIPGFVTEEELERAAKTLIEKGKDPEVKDVVRETLHEGRCVQMLHVGPYEKEGDTIALMVAMAEENGLVAHGRHHEIYISDPRRVPPERLKTILRMPVKADG